MLSSHVSHLFALFDPSFFSPQHLHPKEAVAATAADFEDDFEEKSPSAKSFSLRGAVAAASAEDAADKDEELIQWRPIQYYPYYSFSSTTGCTLRFYMLKTLLSLSSLRIRGAPIRKVDFIFH